MSQPMIADLNVE